MTVLKQGSSGRNVVELQKLLSRLGYGIAVDGKFGPATRGAVVAWQTSLGVVADGIVGPQTLAAQRAKFPTIAHGIDLDTPDSTFPAADQKPSAIDLTLPDSAVSRKPFTPPNVLPTRPGPSIPYSYTPPAPAPIYTNVSPAPSPAARAIGIIAIAGIMGYFVSASFRRA